MTKRSLAFLSAAVMLVSLGAVTAPIAQARDLTPGEFEWVITPEDLRTPTGKILDTATNQMGQTIPSSCSNVNSGKTADGRISLSTVVGEIDYRNGTTWQSTVWTYNSPATARTSFTKLQTASLKLCNDRFTGLIGDDVADMPAVLVDRAQEIGGGTQPRFAVSSSQVLTDPTNARPGYSDSHRYTVFTLIDNAIVQTNVFQVDRTTAAQRADARRAATAIAQRYAASE